MYNPRYKYIHICDLLSENLSFSQIAIWYKNQTVYYVTIYEYFNCFSTLVQTKTAQINKTYTPSDLPVHGE